MKNKIEVDVKDWTSTNLKYGDYFEYKDEIYKFQGYDFGTCVIGVNIETGEQIELIVK